MTQKALSAVFVSLGLIAGGGLTFAHYAAADNATNTLPAVTASAVTSTVSPKEENDAAEKVAEQNMTPAQKTAKEAAEKDTKDSAEKNDTADKPEANDPNEMNDASEAQLTPAQKAALDASEAAQGGESKTGNDSQESD
jgi:cytoskeletal protein RodZ